jgi:hypothetical protein
MKKEKKNGFTAVRWWMSYFLDAVNLINNAWQEFCFFP